MTLRQYERRVRVSLELLKESEKREWTRTAVSVAYMMNMVGGAAGGKKWKQVKPNSLLKQWLGSKKEGKADKMARIKRAMKLHEERLKREKSKKVL